MAPITDIDQSLREYIENEIIPRYEDFDKGHGTDHVNHVITEALRLSRYYDVNKDMIYTAAAYHDTGLCKDRKTHHEVSATIIRNDETLRRWFSEEQIETIAEAAYDHRASSDHEPRTIYGKIIAEADRQIDVGVVLGRTIQFGLKNYPELDMQGHWERTLEHLQEKYADGGYLKLWIPQSSNARNLEQLRQIIRDPKTLRVEFEKIYLRQLFINGIGKEQY